MRTTFLNLPRLSLRSIIVMVCVLLAPAFQSSLAVAQNIYSLGPGNQVPVRLVTAVSSEEGTLVHAVVDRDITTANNQILITAGTPVKMEVQKRPTRGLGKGGHIRLTPKETFSVDNQIIFLNGGYEASGKSRQKLTWALAAGSFAAAVTGGIVMMVAGFSSELENDSGAALGAAGAGIVLVSPFTWFFLLLHGRPAEVPAGTVIENVYPNHLYNIGL